MPVRVRYPGYRWLIGPTEDWHEEVGGPFAWWAYGPQDEEGMSLQGRGFARSMDEARDAALAWLAVES